MVMPVVMVMVDDFGFFVFACSLVPGIGNPLRYGRGAASQRLDEQIHSNSLCRGRNREGETGI
jgi:hypothetical protein